ncbi:tetratricopeptide repeat protein [Epilithonimonas xixisoli]|uniref:Putative negative regulator of RcsB-dependent stress response n=1 Tax=Epilithonimonas xixisoli TaxID=1476462 RepID=A0A4R8I5M8_9FLAO|nr:tetratricopeptide repeat protein [Epilithonimonas xixisoli]TDX84223.1 putative negative regulator of RcsB-dependent stress response [Epilithonimonas xixisoli]
MANNHNTKNEQEGKETVEFFRDLDKEALNIESFLEKNAKTLSIGFGVLIVAVLGWFGYQQFILGPQNEEATKSYLVAQKNLAEGKEDLALGGKSVANPGFIGTFEEYGSTKAGKLSAYNAGLIEFKKGNYQKAYDLLDKFSSGNKVLVALKYGAMADCLSNLNKADDALAMADKAASASDDAYTSYYFTKKAGILALALKKNADAKKYFATIDEKYQDYDNGQSDAFIEMTKYY